MSDQNDLQPKPGFVFKILNGSLNGIEFSLGAHDYFMCVGDAGAEQGNLAFSERTLYLPSATPGNNFIINLATQIDDSFDVTVCFPTQQETRSLALNRVNVVDEVWFAVRREADAWSAEVVSGVRNLAHPIQVGSVPVPIENKKSSRPKKSNTAFLLLAVMLLVSGVAYLVSKHFSDQPVVVANKLEAIVGDRAGYVLQPGKNGIYYLFAADLQSAEWAQQALQRKNLEEIWKVVTPLAEEARVASLLDRYNIAFFAIRFTDPASPTLIMSKSRNSTDQANLNHVMELMLTEMPYAHNIHIILHDDSEVLNKAQQGLKALGLEFQTVRSDSGVTLLSGLPSVDVHLSEFSRFVAAFYQTWGSRYVHFSADIHDDELKGKSYKYGDDGYVTMNKSHWMFNRKMD